MRRLLSALVVLLTLAGQSARPQAAEEEFVTVEVTLGRKHGKAPRTLHPPVVRGERKFVDDKWDGGGWAYVGSCDENIGCAGDIIVTADYVTGDSSKVMVVLRYDDRRRCNQTKEFTLTRGETTELKMKCGARVKAIHAPRPKAAN